MRLEPLFHFVLVFDRRGFVLADADDKDLFIAQFGKESGELFYCVYGGGGAVIGEDDLFDRVETVGGDKNGAFGCLEDVLDETAGDAVIGPGEGGFGVDDEEVGEAGLGEDLGDGDTAVAMDQREGIAADAGLPEPADIGLGEGRGNGGRDHFGIVGIRVPGAGAKRVGTVAAAFAVQTADQAFQEDASETRAGQPGDITAEVDGFHVEVGGVHGQQYLFHMYLFL